MDYDNTIIHLPEPWKSFNLENIFAAHFEGYPKEYILIKRIIERNIKDPTIDLASNSLVISPYLWEVLSGKKHEDIKDLDEPEKSISKERYDRYLLRNETKENIQIELINHKAYINALKLNAKNHKCNNEQFQRTIDRRICGLELMKEQIVANQWPNLMLVTPQIGEVIKDKDSSFSINPRWETSVLVNNTKGKNSGVIFYFPKENIQSRKRFIQRWHEVKAEYAKARTDWPSGLNSSRDIPFFKEDIVDFNLNSISIIQKLLAQLKQEIVGKTIAKPKIFISYAHKDEKFKDELEEHLSSLKISGRIETWNDRKILPGNIWDKSIKQELESSNIILFLISSSFINSGYIQDVEIKKSIERHKAGKAIIIPVILRPCDFTSLDSLATFQAIPKDALPVTRWADADEAYLDVIKGIKKVIDNLD